MDPRNQSNRVAHGGSIHIVTDSRSTHGHIPDAQMFGKRARHTDVEDAYGLIAQNHGLGAKGGKAFSHAANG